MPQVRLALVHGTALLALAGCARNADVVRIADDTYRVSVGAATTASARELALSQAARKCAALGRDVEIVDVRGGSPEAGGAATVTFRCAARIHR